jgi:integrase
MITKIRGIKQTTVKGRRYYYHRATKKRIEARPNTPAFILEIAELDKEAGTTPRRAIVRRRPHGSGTWGALVEAYRASAKYTLLGERTKSDYDKVLAYLATLNDFALVQFDPEACEKIRDKALQDKKRRFANYVVHMLSLVLGWGKTRREFGHFENGAVGLKKFAAPGDANRPWSEDECRIVLAEAKGTLRAAVALGMFASMRGGDVVCVRWSDYNGTAIQWQQNKTADPVWKPARRMLRAILDAAPRIGETIVAGADGRPWADGTLRANFRELIRGLEDEGRIAKGLTFHGLRSTNATRLADAGADVRAIQAELGQRTAAMALHYSRRADMRRAAETAVRLLDDEA